MQATAVVMHNKALRFPGVQKDYVKGTFHMRAEPVDVDADTETS